MKNKIKNILIIVLIIAVSTATSVMANTLIDSKEVAYDNSKSGIKSTNVQAAVDELYSAATDYSSLKQRITKLEKSTITIDKIYPVGSVYISTTDDTVEKVSERFGGTWERYAEGRTLIGAGTGTDSNGTVRVFNVNDSLGEYTHTLTINEMPSHDHTAVMTGVNNENPWTTLNTAGSEKINPYMPTTTGKTGGSQSHNNIQPSIVTYMYKRVK